MESRTAPIASAPDRRRALHGTCLNMEASSRTSANISGPESVDAIEHRLAPPSLE